MAGSSPWRAWYEDGSVYSSADTTVEDLPDEGIIGVVVYREPPYRVILDGGDWYWIDGKWKTTANSIWGDWVDPPQDVDRRLLKRSGSLPNDQWARVRDAMHAAKDWPE